MRLYTSNSLIVKHLVLGLVFMLGSWLPASSQQQISLNWVNAHAVPLSADTAVVTTKLPFLDAQLKGNALCGLGEASHGTHEFGVQKSRIIQYLITRLQYRKLGFEFGYTAMDHINNYLQTGKGNLKQLMEPLHLFKTQEIYNLLQWIAQYNRNQPASRKVTLFGFDTDYIKADVDASAALCATYLKAHAKAYRQATEALPVLQKIGSAAINNLYELTEAETNPIQKLYTEVSTNQPNPADTEWQQFKRHLQLLYQGTLLSNPLARDEFMAKNIAAMQPSTQNKTIIWGHKVHIAKDTTMAQFRGMGYYLRQKYTRGYYTIALDTYKGSVHVLDGDDWATDTFEAQPTSITALLSQARYPLFFLAVDQDSPLYNVAGSITNIFANHTRNPALPIRPGVDFDALLFVRESTASIVLK